MYTFDPDHLNIGMGSKDCTTQPVFYIQTSLLYTNEARQRLLRVHNYSLKISKDLSEVYGGMDYQTVVASVIRKKLPNFVSQLPLIDIQLEIINDFKKLFKGIAGQTTTHFQSSVLPYLALGFLGILKSSVFQAHYINNCLINS